MTLTWVCDTDWGDNDWREKAACQHSHAGLFFPVGSTGHALEMIDAAKEVCEQCPVSEPCLQFALDTNQEAGVWGGYTEDERRVIRRAHATAAS